MIRRIEQVFRPPLFEDEEKTIQVRWLNGILLLLLTPSLVGHDPTFSLEKTRGARLIVAFTVPTPWV
jgi:hypothetical protein